MSTKKFCDACDKYAGNSPVEVSCRDRKGDVCEPCARLASAYASGVRNDDTAKTAERVLRILFAH